MEKKEFNSLFKDLIAHLYDYTVLETHPLIAVITPPSDYRGSHGEYLRQIILEEIERFKPTEKPLSPHAVEWRPYNILYKRYVEGTSLRELSQALSLSERQLRRDNSRALQALAGRLWGKLIASDENRLSRLSTSADDQSVAQQTFDTNLETLNLNSVIQGIASILQKRIEADGFSLTLEEGGDPIQVMADRIVTRQILISLISYLLDFPCQREIYLRTQVSEQHASVHIQSELAEPWYQEDGNEHRDLLESAQYWSQHMSATIHESYPSEGEIGPLELTFSLPLAKQPIILVVDDQKPTQQMFRRFLSRSAYQIVGVTDPGEVISLAHQLKPVLITLDVMMPKVDGWEILQALQTDIKTKDIPILVCSAWEAPELAKSLGAAGFLKKPIRQRDLLAALDRLNL